MLIFLDFDGVLRRKTSSPMTFDAPRLECFEAAVRSAPKARIVVTSSWRDVESLSQIRARFAGDVCRNQPPVIPAHAGIALGGLRFRT